ncbi:S-layer homology domain-containing protein [Paenibacillus sp. GCM10027628]|uniref:S-layer homology domain-containing protein n=1 Tax=Paenibacillus sp. GCM10027628 TaxID=3273413 RepID=UPI00363DDAC4
MFRYTSVDEIKIPRELATGVTFTDNDSKIGSIQGIVNWTNPADTSYLSGFSLYFLDGQGHPISLITRVPKTATSFTINTMSIPSGAVRIGVYSYNQWAESVKCTSTPIWDFSSFLPKNINFLDTNPAKGQIHGLLSWTPAADESLFSKYAVYFTDNTGHKIGPEPFALVTNGQTTYSLEIPESDMPAGASTVTIYSYTNSGEMPTWNAFVRITDNILSEAPSVASVTYGLPGTGIPTNPSYQDLNPTLGKINGQISWTGLSTDTLGSSYKVYFLDTSYKTVGSVAEVPVDVLKSYRITLPSDTTLPAGATYFGIVRKSSSGNEDTKALILSINDLGGTVTPAPTPTPAPEGEPDHSGTTPLGNDTEPSSSPQPDSSSNLPKPVVTTGTDRKITVTLTFTDEQMKVWLANQSASGGNTVKIEIPGDGSTIQSVLAGTAIQQILAANSKASLEASTSLAAITIQAAEVQRTLQQIGQNVSNVNISISVSQADTQIRSQLESLLNGSHITQMTQPIDFRITATATSDNQQYVISTTTSYVIHTIPLPTSETPGSTKTLAGIMYDPGTNKYYPVPTVFTTDSDGTLQASLYRQGNSIYTVVSNPKTFADVPVKHYAKDAIETLASKFIISGYDDNTFKSEKPVTRAEFAALLIRAMGIIPKKVTKAPFQDIRDGDWYYDAVSAATDAGFISGYKDGTFRPNQTVR